MCFKALLPVWWQWRVAEHPLLQELTQGQVSGLLTALTTFYDTLCRFNAHTNVTRITEPLAFLERHVWESWAGVLPHLEAWKTSPIAPVLRYLDIGSGGGVPLVPVCLLLEACGVAYHAVGVDTVAKKVAWMHQVTQALGLHHVEVLHARIESLGQMPIHRHQYHWVSARAVAHLAVLLEVGIPLLVLTPTQATQPHGQLLCWKGTGIIEESQQSKLLLERLFVSETMPVQGMPRLDWEGLQRAWTLPQHTPLSSLSSSEIHQARMSVAEWVPQGVPSEAVPTTQLLSVYGYYTRKASPKAYPRKEGKPFQKPLRS
jgi:16S rRNA (guanine(527)-N(7))-methyltransferase RsmG